VRVARGHHDCGGDLGAVDEGDAADALAAAHDRVDLALRPQGATGCLERSEQRGRKLPTPTDRPTDGGHLAHRVGQGAEPTAGQLGGDAPHHRPGQGGRPHDRLLVEVRTQDVGSAAARPAHQGARTVEPAAQREAGQAGNARRFGGRVEDHTNRRHGGGEIAPVAVDLGGEVAPDVVERGIGIAVVRPARAGGCADHEKLCCAGSRSMYSRPWAHRSRSSITGVVRKVRWSQLQMLTVAPANCSLAAVPPTSERASTSSVDMPARARYAAVTSPLCPAPITMASKSAPGRDAPGPDVGSRRHARQSLAVRCPGRNVPMWLS
jgi:hypothetical protein